MSSRKEQKEQARAERVAKEEAARQETSRRRRMQIGAVAGGVAIIAVIVVVIVATGGGGGDDSSSSGGSAPTFAKGSVPASAEVGLQDTPPPWAPDYNHMAERVKALGLPGFNETISHTHAWLHVYADGKKVAVPPNIGIDQATQSISPLHTHDPSGIIHMEADRDYDFTLGQFLDVWGVDFSADQIGSLKAKGADQQLQVYLNGQKVSDPVNLIMPEQGNIVVGYGKPGSFETEPKLDWPEGL